MIIFIDCGVLKRQRNETECFVIYNGENINVQFAGTFVGENMEILNTECMRRIT